MLHAHATHAACAQAQHSMEVDLSMAPRDYTILGDWTTTPPGLLVMLPGGHPGLNLGRAHL